MRFSAALLALIVITPPPQERLEGAYTARLDRDQLQVNLQTNLDRGRGRSGWSNYGRSITANDITITSRANGRIEFTLQRAAGTFTFEGRGDADRSNGSFSFAPNATFQAGMARLGFEGLSATNLFVFALDNLTIERAAAAAAGLR